LFALVKPLTRLACGRAVVKKAIAPVILVDGRNISINMPHLCVVLT